MLKSGLVVRRRARSLRGKKNILKKIKKPEKVFYTAVPLQVRTVRWRKTQKYKKNQENKTTCFIPRKALLDDLNSSDFNELNVDFSVINTVLSKFDKSLYNLDSGKYFLTISDDFDTIYSNYYVGVDSVYQDLSICYLSSDINNPQKNIIFFDNIGI